MPRPWIALLGGVVPATVVEGLQMYAFNHALLADGWLVVGGSYGFVGLVTATPAALLRPHRARVVLGAGLLAVVAFCCGDVCYNLVAALHRGPAFDLMDYLRSYREFQNPRTLAEESMAPLAAAVMTALNPAWFRRGTPETVQPRIRFPHYAEID